MRFNAKGSQFVAKLRVGCSSWASDHHDKIPANIRHLRRCAPKITTAPALLNQLPAHDLRVWNEEISLAFSTTRYAATKHPASQRRIWIWIERSGSPASNRSLGRRRRRHRERFASILSKNLRHTVKQLSDGELDELCEAAFDEAKRRRRMRWSIGAEPTPSSRRPSESATKRSLPLGNTKRRQVDVAEITLTRGQMNAVRSAFRAGITPSRFARQFGISQSNVRKALASDEWKR
jgi:hypothetical protein